MSYSDAGLTHPFPVQFSRVQVEEPALDRLLSALRAIFVKGSALLGCFSISMDANEWFAAGALPHYRSPLVQIGGGIPAEHESSLNYFLASDAVAQALPDLWVSKAGAWRASPAPTEPHVVTDPQYQWTYPLAFDSELARTLLEGGPYLSFEGAPGECKRLALSVCDAIFGDRNGELWVYKSFQPWSPWFFGISWDFTWVLVDTGRNRIWLLCITDTD